MLRLIKIPMTKTHINLLSKRRKEIPMGCAYPYFYIKFLYHVLAFVQIYDIAFRGALNAHAWLWRVRVHIAVLFNCLLFTS